MRVSSWARSAVLRVGRTTAFAAALLPAAFLIAGTASAASATDDVAATASSEWPMFGQNIQNTASAREVSVRDISKLTLKWQFTTGGDVSARAAVVGGIAYFPDWGGNLWALNGKTGAKVWGHQLSDYGLPANTHSRTSPAVADGVVYVGTQEGAWMLAIDAQSGDLLWKTQLESPTVDSYAMVTASPAISGNLLFTGIASNQEGAAASVPGFVCCTARGSVVALYISGPRKGQIAWQTYTIPPGYSGGAVWGSNFAIDPTRNTVFVGTGNNYSHPTDPAYLNVEDTGSRTHGSLA